MIFVYIQSAISSVHYPVISRRRAVYIKKAFIPALAHYLCGNGCVAIAHVLG
jgi:hypothetical protein